MPQPYSKLLCRHIAHLTCALLLSYAAAANAAGNTLQIVVNGVHSDQGSVRAGLYSGPDTFPKEGKAAYKTFLPATTGTEMLTLRDLPDGRYALIVYHDENNNGELDKRFGMIPIEGYGLSNNPNITGKPSFDECAFELKGNQRIEINLKY